MRFIKWDCKRIIIIVNTVIVGFSNGLFNGISIYILMMPILTRIITTNVIKSASFVNATKISENNRA